MSTKQNVLKYIYALIPTAFMCIAFTACGYINGFCQAYAQRIAESMEGRIFNSLVLPDIGFKYLPVFENHEFVEQALPMLYAITIARGVLQGWDFITLFRRVLVIHGPLFILRGFSNVITMLPNPLLACKPIVDENLFVAAWKIVNGTNKTCADCLYSGHALAGMMIWLCWTRYYHPQNWWLKNLIVRPVIIVFWILLIASRYHYTVDVLYGILVSSKWMYEYEWFKWFEQDSMIE